MGWPEERSRFEQRQNSINTYMSSQYDKDVASFNEYASAFVISGGMSGTPVPHTVNGRQLDGDAVLMKLYESYSRIKAKYKETEDLKDDIATYLIGASTTSDIQAKLRDIGTLQQEVLNLEDVAKKAETEDVAANDRQRAIQERKEKVSFPQMFSGINKSFEKRTYQWLFPLGLALFIVGVFLMWPGIKTLFSLPASVLGAATNIELPFYKKPAFVLTILALMGASIVVTFLAAFGVISS
jgi:hypothetical protein